MIKMGNRYSNSEIGKEDIDENNGLVLNSYHIPEEIICEILNKLSPQEILQCRLVCKRWINIINYLLCNNYNKIYNTRYTNEILPFDMCYITLYGVKCKKNLLKNVNGEEKFKHWRIMEDGGDRLKIEDPPAGSEPLPENIEEFNGHTSCFASSFGYSIKRQYIDVKRDKHLSFIINTYKPHIYVSEWVAGRFDCGARYEMYARVECKGNHSVEKRTQHQVSQWEGSTWCKKEFVIEEYPDNVEYIVFEHGAKDTQFWKGHYGMKMAGAVVKLLLDKIKL